MDDRFDFLFSPGKLGHLTLKNRVVMTAASCSLCAVGGGMTEDMLTFYERRARGGVALIITEMVCVEESHGRLFERELNAARDENIPEFQKLADRVHPHCAKIFAQLFHPGANADPKLNPGGLLSVEEAVGKKRGTARAATRADIEQVAEAFGAAAKRVQDAGFDGVEIHGAHHYFLHSFLSPLTNHRTDEFGGSLENRARPLRMILEAVRKTCGKQFPLMVRVSLEEYVGKDGYHADTGLKLCRLLESWGADAINVTVGGTASKLSQSMEPVAYLQGWRKHFLRAVKRTVKIPVCGVSVIRDPAYAEMMLVSGDTDFVGSVRAHLADPDWTAKAFSGREADIVPCLSCMSCLEMHNRTGRISCAMNPETGYEAQLPPPVQNGGGRLVAVLGAGPAGLEAALTAARRGFRVVVFEKEERAGGQVLLAAKVPRKERLQLCIASLLRRCEQAGVEFHYQTVPTAPELKKLAPYALFDATGGLPRLPGTLPGIESPLVCTPQDVLTGRVDPREESVVVVGSGLTGLETAEILSQRERNNCVAILEAAGRIAPGALGSNRNSVTSVLDVNNVVYMLSRTLTGIGEDRIWFSDTRTGEEYVYPCDRVVLALGTEPARSYPDAPEAVCEIVETIGDANTPGKIWDAIHSGYRAAVQLTVNS